MVLTPLNTYVAIKKECIKLKLIYPIFSPDQWEGLWLMERSRVKFATGDIT